MAQLSSEDALNGIFNILETMIIQLNEERQKAKENKTDDTIANLLSGNVKSGGNKSGVSAGEQLEKLSKGLIAISKIDKEQLDGVIATIERVNNVLSNIKIDDKTVDNIDGFLKTLDKITEINVEGSKKIIEFINNLTFEDPKKTYMDILTVKTFINAINDIAKSDLKNLSKNLNTLDLKTAAKLGKFIDMFFKELKKSKVFSSGDVKEYIKPISDLMSGLSSIISSNIWKMKISLNPIKGYLLGRQIGQFIHQIAKRLKGDKIDESMKYIGSIFDPMIRLADPKNDFSIWKLRWALSSGNAKAIGNFYAIIINLIPDGKQVNEAVSSIQKIIETFTNISLGLIITFNLMAKSLNKGNATKLNEFIKELIDGEWDADKVKSVNEFLAEWRKTLFTVVASLAIIVAMVALTGIKTIVVSLLTFKFVVNKIKNTIIDLSEIKPKDAKNAAEISKSVGLTIAMVMASVALMSLVTKISGVTNVLISIAVLTVTVAGMMFIIKLLNKKGLNKEANNAIKVIYALSVAMLAISAAMLILTTAISKATIGDVILSVGTIVAVIGSFIGVVYFLSKKVDDKDLSKATDALLKITAVFTIISLVTSLLIIPIGKQLEDVIKGSLVVLSIIGLGIVAIKLLDDKEAKKGAETMLILAGVFAIVSLVTALLIIPIGKKSKDAAIGAVVTLLIIGALIFGVKLLNLIGTGELKNGIMALAALTFILLGVSLITKELLVPIGKMWEEAAKGGAVVLGILTIMGGIMFAIGKFANKFETLLLEGGKIMAMVGALMAITGLTVLAFAWESKKVYELNKDYAVLKGGGLILAILVVMGLVMTGIGSLMTNPLALIMLAGAGTLLAIGVAMDLIGLTVLKYAHICKDLVDFNKGDIISKGTDVLVKSLMLMGLALAELSPIVALVPLMLLAGTALTPMMGVFGLLSVMALLMKLITKICQPADVLKFKEIVIGKGDNDKNSLLGSVKAIVDGFKNIPFTGAAAAAIISALLQPVMLTISEWVAIVKKVATMNYISGYDENGKPIYLSLPPSVFKDAADVVTTGFNDFLTKLTDGFSIMDGLKLVFLGIISAVLTPVINTVSKFVDIVMRVATGTYITGYDEKGKPIYLHLNSSQFANAANAVSTLFSLFLTELGKGFDALDDRAIYAMNAIKKSISPIMDSVASFVDAVIKVATLLIITGYDEKGKPEYEKVEIERIKSAGITVAEIFGTFITNLGTAFKGLTPSTIMAMNNIRKSISPLMDGVSSFVDAIIKLATGLYIDHYEKDKDGNYTVPVFGRLTHEEYKQAAFGIALYFATFISTLANVFDKHSTIFGNSIDDALEAIAGSIKPVMDGVGQYVDAILKLAGGTYIAGYKKGANGKDIPIYNKITPAMFINAAKTIGRMFTEFISYLAIKLSEKDLYKKAEEISDSVKNTISPIMSAVKQYSDAIKPYVGKDMKQIKIASDGIAKALISFITTVTTDFNANKAKYADAKNTATIVNSFMKSAYSSIYNLSKIIKSMKDDKGNVLNGDGIATLFKTTLNAFADVFVLNIKKYQSALQVSKTVLELTKQTNKIISSFSGIVNTLRNLVGEGDKTSVSSLINLYNTNINKIADNMVQLTNKADNMNVALILLMVSQFYSIAGTLNRISTFMDSNKNITSGINTFVKNINTLVSPTRAANMKVTANSIQLYTTRLKSFTAQIIRTTAKVKLYITELESARVALKKLDEQIIGREKDRNKALENFANKINDITTAVNNMRSAFESLDENKILSRFDGIRALLDLITGGDDNNQNTNNNTLNKQQQQTRQQNTQQRGQNTLVQRGQNQQTTHVVQQGLPSAGRVVFEFKNIKLDGFYHT